MYPDTDGDKQPTYCYSHGNYDDMDILKCFQTDNFDQAVDMANRYYEKFTKFYTVGKDCGSCLMDMRWDMAKDEGFFKCEAPVHAPPLTHTNELTTVGDICNACAATPACRDLPMDQINFDTLKTVDPNLLDRFDVMLPFYGDNNIKQHCQSTMSPEDFQAKFNPLNVQLKAAMHRLPGLRACNENRCIEGTDFNMRNIKDDQGAFHQWVDANLHALVSKVCPGHRDLDTIVPHYLRSHQRSVQVERVARKTEEVIEDWELTALDNANAALENVNANVESINKEVEEYVLKPSNTDTSGAF